MITGWKDDSPAVEATVVKPRPQEMQYEAFRIPERGDDAALRQTLRAVRTATTHKRRAVHKVEASAFYERASRHGSGGLYLVPAGEKNVASNRTYAYPGDWIVVNATGEAQVVAGPMFETLWETQHEQTEEA